MPTDVATCTGLTATWCPIHGDCTCGADDQPCWEGCSRCTGEHCDTHGDDPCDCDVADRHDREYPEPGSLNREDCPLHGTASDHPFATWAPDVLDVLRAGQGAPEASDVADEDDVLRAMLRRIDGYDPEPEASDG